MNWITKSAAMLVFESGSTTSRKKRIGTGPSMRAASASSSGTVRKNWRKRNVAVAEAMSGRVSPTYELIMPRSDTTLNVGMMRTTTGSMRVTKIIQKKKLRSGKRKNTMAKEAMIEIAILPQAIASAMTRLLNIMGPTGAATPFVG